jgi:hypothetical protein
LKRAGDEREPPRETKLNSRGRQNRRGQLLATAPTNRRVQHAPQNIRRDLREPLALTAGRDAPPHAHRMTRPTRPDRAQNEAIWRRRATRPTHRTTRISTDRERSASTFDSGRNPHRTTSEISRPDVLCSPAWHAVHARFGHHALVSWRWLIDVRGQPRSRRSIGGLSELT